MRDPTCLMEKLCRCQTAHSKILSDPIAGLAWKKLGEVSANNVRPLHFEAFLMKTRRMRKKSG